LWPGDPFIIGVEHVGSTAVEGPWLQKPIIDIDVVINSYDVFPAVKERLFKNRILNTKEIWVLKAERLLKELL